jgi:hypothetical protein
MDGAGPASPSDELVATMPFVDRAAGHPVIFLDDMSKNIGRFIPVAAPVQNGRRQAPASLDREGFTFVRSPTTVSDFYDEVTLRDVYYPEVAALVKAETGAARIIVCDHIVRNDTASERGGVRVSIPAQFTHNDYTPASIPARLREFVTDDEAERLLRGRMVEINVWRPIRGPLRTKPLAVCDATTLQPDDFMTAEYRLRGRIDEFYVIAYRPGQRWVYFPDMQRDEALLIKCYDTDPANPPFGGHGAMDDPTTPPDALPRESIEVRVFAFFAPQ